MSKNNSPRNSQSKQLDQNNGCLSEKQITQNLSNLGRTAIGTKFAYLNLSLPGLSLNDINLLAKFRELQTLDLSFNDLNDLSVLSELPFLLNLNVSNNKIEKLFDFLPSNNLKEADFSFNKIKEIGNVSNFHYLQTLKLNNNSIERIEGLEYCQRLKHLNLAHNLIKRIEGLDNLPLISLDLNSNQIKRIEGLNPLKYLRFLNLADNMIKSLSGMPDKHEFIEQLDMEGNRINSLSEIEYLTGFNLLRDLNLLSNPIREVEDYYSAVVFKLPKLIVLDRQKIDSKDKVGSTNLFHPSAEYIASRDHMTNLIFNIIQDHKVRESTLPNIDSPYPILLLSGPEGSYSSEMAIRLAKDFPEYFDYVVTYTTRQPKTNDNDKANYNYITMQDFENDVTQGKFICCNEYFGDWYGTQWDSIESVAKQGLACVINMELESLLSFKQTYFEPRCVLILTLDKKIQKKRLLDSNKSESECEVAMNRTEMYAEYNRQHPGFFDAVIESDDAEKGYENLKKLVLNYLGVANNQEQKDSYDDNSLSNHRQLSMIQSSRHKEQLNERSDSFLPSNTATGNRSQMSHLSITSLSQIYNQNLRLKFGSAPAQLLTKGEQAEKSLEKRASQIKKQFDLNNVVSAKSQLSQHQHLMSKQAMQGTVSSASWNKSKLNSRNENFENKTKGKNDSS
ncbi:unnamed protein product [Brachionus calyciflorus]|uniref:Guanylate kinase-like domain-containing protein n=1 Tax=Brachionus calyciflorus TaxID=104777 RepID=A0A814G6N9_9BILA|nr:unnamed protein product [Brachionus calyciflorus]